MGRKANLEIKDQIEKEARKLFLEKGYHATSISDIAKTLNKEKSYVQRHFPKKDLFIYNFFSDLLDSSNEFFELHGLKDEDYYVNLYLIGTTQFAFLLSSDELRRFTVDILSDRSLTELLISENIAWASKYLVDFSLEEQDNFKDNVIVVMGGIYELVYNQLSKQHNINPSEIQKMAMKLFTFVQGIDPCTYSGKFNQNVLSDDLLRKSIVHLNERLFN